MVPMLFSEVRASALADNPVLLLREAQGERVLAVWISAMGGNAILSALEGFDDESHPVTHDLMVEALAVLDAVVEAVHITGVHEGVYDAEVVVNGEAVAARVSDAVALALRCGAPILASEDLLTEVGITGASDGGDVGVQDEQVEQFRAFLDTVSPDDFDPGAQP